MPFYKIKSIESIQEIKQKQKPFVYINKEKY